MSEYVKRLKDQRNKTWEQAKALLDHADAEGRDLSAAEQEQYARLNEELDSSADHLRKIEEDDQRRDDAHAAFERLVRGGRQTVDTRALNSELRQQASGHNRAPALIPLIGPGEPVMRNARDIVAEVRAVDTSTGTSGSIGVSVFGRVISAMTQSSGLLAAGPTVLRTETGESMKVPTSDSTSTAAIVAEGGTIPESDPDLDQAMLGAYKYGFMVQATYELINDAAFDVQAFLAEQAGRALGLGYGAHLVAGSGSGQPAGVVGAATVGTTGDAAAPTAEDLIDLQHSLAAPYWGSASFLMSPATLGVVRKLREDGETGGFLFSTSESLPGAAGSLLGRPVFVDDNVPATGAEARSVLFGDFSRYFVRFAGNLRFERSDDYAFDTDEVTWRALVRADGALADSSAVKAFVGAAA